jgi:aldehyde:ferredoxin oxidoreductase
VAYGYRGKILEVDLTHQRISVEHPEDTFYRRYLGGRGIGYDYLLKEVPAGTDAFAPENVLVLATGAMTGAPLPASCRFAAVSKSPLTGAAGESEAAGFFGPELKKAGFDAIVLRGRAEQPVYLWITEDQAELKDARSLAQLGAREVEDAIRHALGGAKIRVAQTGLAGMRRVRFANITNNLGHFNGRGGLGAVMGAKNLRAVAARGTHKIPLFDPDFIRRTAKAYAQTFRNHPLGEALHVYGTTAFCELLSAGGGLPVNNFRRSQLADPEPVSGDAYIAQLLKKRKGCHACPIQCKRTIGLDDPKYGIDSRYGGPEYETMAALGTNLNITDLRVIAKANEICNRYCMDTISAGMTIAFACECFEKGLITEADTDGLALRMGDGDLLIRLLEMIAHRQGVGDLMAEGSHRLARHWKVEDAAAELTVKGMEIPMHDPRVKAGVGLGFAVGPYGTDHMTAPHDPFFVDPEAASFKSVNALGILDPLPATALNADKVRHFMILEKLWRAMDALGLCVFGYAPRGVMPLEVMVQCVTAVTGWNTSLYELLDAGERASMLARAFNSREGFSIQNDRLPQRLFEPKPDGPGAGQAVFSPQAFDAAVALYYAMIGCDPGTGRPQSGKLAALGLAWVDDMLNRSTERLDPDDD